MRTETPIAPPKQDDNESVLTIRRDIVLNRREKQRYYGQLVDMEYTPFEVDISDSATSMTSAHAHGHAKL